MENNTECAVATIRRLKRELLTEKSENDRLRAENMRLARISLALRRITACLEPRRGASSHSVEVADGKQIQFHDAIASAWDLVRSHSATCSSSEKP